MSIQYALMDKQIVKHNAAIKAAYRLTLDEQRLMMLCITKVRRDAKNPRRFTIRHDEYCEEFKTSYAYRNMRDAAMRLQQRIIKVGETVIDGKKYDGGAISVLSRHMWQENEGEIMLDFSEFFMPFLESLSRDFTRFGLKDIARMKSIYSIRIYELLKMASEQQKKNSEPVFNIEISELRRMFELEGKYSRHEAFRRKVIDVAVAEINEYSPLLIEYEQIKKGRRIHALKFNISRKKESYSLQPTKNKKEVQKAMTELKEALKMGLDVRLLGKDVREVNGAVVSFKCGTSMNLYNALIEADCVFEVG